MSQPPDSTSFPSPSRLVLVGAGHAHLHLLQQRQALGADEVVLVDPGAFWYSGMANGVLGGALASAANRLDPKPLARSHGVTALRARLTGLDRVRRQVHLDDGSSLPFTLLSLNLGSLTPTPAVRRPGPHVWAVKPLPLLLALRRHLEQAFRRGERLRLVVAGGGASGVEVACNLRALARRHGASVEITLVTGSSRLLDNAPLGASRWLARLLTRRGIRVLTETRVAGHTAAGAMIHYDASLSGEDSLALLEADHVIHATGLMPPSVIERLGLPVIAGRGLAVDATLQSVGDPDIFAAGDCAAMTGHQLPRLGVYSVRQGPILRENLAARLAGKPLKRYEPQAQALAILDLGEGMGLAIRGHRWWAGRLALGWKRWLDRRFLAHCR